MITKSECKKKINELLESKNIKNKDFYFELYLNIYFLLDKKRKLAQLYIYKKRHPDIKSEDFKSILKKDYPFFILEEDKKSIRFILYRHNYDITKINQTFTKKYAKDLGDFYVCANDLEKIYKKYKNKYLLQPSINAIYHNKNEDITEVSIFVQMCPPNVCIQNLDLFFKIKQDFEKTVQKINKNIHMYFSINAHKVK